MTPDPLDPIATDVSGSVPDGAAALLGAPASKITAEAVGLAVVVVVAFWLGRRRGRRGATVLEIRRV